MRAFIIIGRQPLVKVLLKVLNISINLFAKSNFIELIQRRLVEGLADPILLGPPGSGLCVLDLMILKEDLIGMLVQAPQYSVPLSVKILRTDTP